MWFSFLAVAAPQELPRDDVRPDAVVRPLSRAAERPCSRPGCPSPARATLTFAYAQREAWVERLREQPEPQAYDLCSQHASRTRPPHGWTLKDRRPEEERRIDPPPVTPADLGGERTVALLAAALRAVPDVAPESDDRPPSPTEDAPDDAGDAATASAPVDARVTPGPMLASDPEDDPSPVLGADRASLASASVTEEDGQDGQDEQAVDTGLNEEAVDDGPDGSDAFAPTLDLDDPAPVPRPPLAVRDAKGR
jgi:hypothetical protein